MTKAKPGARMFNGLVKEFTSALGSKPNRAQIELIRHAALLVVRANQLQRTILSGEDVPSNVDMTLTRLANASTRILTELGIQQKRNESVPDIRKYIANKQNDRRPD